MCILTVSVICDLQVAKHVGEGYNTMWNSETMRRLRSVSNQPIEVM